MKQFLAPEEVRTSWWIYLGSVVFTFLGIMLLGGTLRDFIITSRVHGDFTNYQEVEEKIHASFSNNELFITGLLPFVIGFLLLAFCAKVFHFRKFLSFITVRPSFSFSRFLVGFSGWAIIMGVLFIIQMSSNPSNISWNFNSDDFLILLAITVVVVPLQTGFEEVFLRGFLLQMFGRTTRRGIIAILCSAAIFGLMHLANPEMDALGWQAMVFYCVSGIMTAFIVVMDDGLELSWGFHTANNFFGILILTNRWQAFQTDALYLDTSKPTGGWEILVIPFVLYPLYVLVLWRIYKWRNIKEKLFQPIELKTKEITEEE